MTTKYMTVEEAKVLVDANIKAGKPVAGIQFQNARGSVGTILPDLSVRGKLQATMTCTAGGPDHVRERSDWHQCYLSPEKAKSKPRKTGGPNTGMSMRLADGTLLRMETILDTDSDELKAAKQANNDAFLAAKDARDTAEANAKAEAAANRQAALDATRAAKAAEKELKRIATLKERAERIKKVAEEMGVKVSPNAPTETSTDTDTAEA